MRDLEEVAAPGAASEPVPLPDGAGSSASNTESTGAADTQATRPRIETTLAAARSLLDRLLEYPQLGLIVALVVFGAGISSESSTFLTRENTVEILRDAVYIFIIGVAATFVFVAGGLDLSVGSILALGGIVSAWLLVAGWPVAVAILAGCGVGVLAGLVNGAITIYAGIPPLITTLGMLYVGQGIVVIVTGGEALLPLPDSFTAIGQTTVRGIPLLVIYAAAIGLLGHVVLSYTRFGYHVRATGGNREGARAMGIKVNRVSLVVYVLSGLAAAASGVLLTSQLGSGQPSVGGTTELQVIAAVIIGGTSLFGGIGTISGTLLGALLLSTIADGLNAVALNPAYQNVVVGVVIVVAVGIDRLRRARMFKRSAVR